MFDSNYLAGALLQLGEHEAALAASQQAWDRVAALLDEEPQKALWRTTQGNFARQHARALAANGQHVAALPVFELALHRAAEVLHDDDTESARQDLAALQSEHAASASLNSQAQPP